jgi:branched-chain amino acid transport system ATP-binding protein
LSDQTERRAMLEVDNVTIRFGGVVALDGVDFVVREGEILGLIGPNGAGKTTCFNAITGVAKPTKGAIRFNSQVVSGRQRHKITRLGIARTFQNIRLFPEMTALENVLVGADARHKTSVVGALLRIYRVPVKKHERTEVTATGGLPRLVQQARNTGQRFCCGWSASTTGPASSPATSRTASNGASRSPGRWPPSRACSVSTSRRPASTRPRRPTCSS